MPALRNGALHHQRDVATRPERAPTDAGIFQLINDGRCLLLFAAKSPIIDPPTADWLVRQRSPAFRAHAETRATQLRLIPFLQLRFVQELNLRRLQLFFEQTQN